MGTQLRQCVEAPKTAGLDKYDSSVQTLRLNLGHKYESLKFKVALENNSAVDRTLNVRVTDGSKQFGNITTVSFDEEASVEVPVKDRNAVFLQFYATTSDDSSCSSGDSSIPVIYDIELD
ncbi:hypothetical protein [Rothia aerolata]|uniref:hypothetical protein n=1 Tax=Rothia aerolata TaxID=1812262 RepID=UPI00166BAF3A|nr:hypothetical protein [Rothia aerolata]